MARDDLTVPRKTKTPLPSSSDESSDSSSLFGKEDKLEEAHRRLHESLCADFDAAEQRRLHESEGDPEDPEEDEDEDEDMKQPTPDRDDRAVVIPWYETVLDTSEEVAKSLYEDQDLKTPAHWASLNDKSIDAMAKQ